MWRDDSNRVKFPSLWGAFNRQCLITWWPLLLLWSEVYFRTQPRRHLLIPGAILSARIVLDGGCGSHRTIQDEVWSETLLVPLVAIGDSWMISYCACQTLWRWMGASPALTLCVLCMSFEGAFVKEHAFSALWRQFGLCLMLVLGRVFEVYLSGMKRCEKRITTDLLVWGLFKGAGSVNVLQEEDHHAVSWSGVVGCALAYAVTGVYSKDSHFVAVGATLVSLPLVLVEYVMSLINVGNSGHIPLRSISWIVDFLRETEAPMIQYIPLVPRFMWLLFWIVSLVICIPLAPTGDVVLSRKWFHLIAVILFTPVTLGAPKLQSLAYAVAIAILIVCERVRRFVPALEHFFEAYLDTHKGEKDKESMIVSHIALVSGCAIPLWLAEWKPHVVSGVHTVTALCGVWTLGVGDAMGAVVGKTWGKTCWSKGSNRTVEGSAAMFLSCILSTLALAQLSDGHTLPLYSQVLTVWIVAALEAHTTQLDNLVLPLAGAGCLQLLSHDLHDGTLPEK